MIRRALIFAAECVGLFLIIGLPLGLPLGLLIGAIGAT